MIGVQISSTITGVESVIRRFENMKRGARGVIVRKATRAATAPQRRSAKATSLYTDRTGMLRKSMIVKIRTKKQADVTYGVVGADRRMVRGDWRRKREIKPSRYLHLVEFGHAKPNGGRVAGRNFLRAAFDESANEAQVRFRSKFISDLARVTEGGSVGE